MRFYMSEIINYMTSGTCCRQMNVEIENDIIKDVELPIKIYALKLKAYIDIKEICGR